jgi:hypothetical protein
MLSYVDGVIPEGIQTIAGCAKQTAEKAKTNFYYTLFHFILFPGFHLL